MQPRLRAIGAGIGVGLLGLIVALVFTAVLVISLQLLGISVGPVLMTVLILLTTQGISFMGVAYGYLRYRDISLSAIGVRVPSLRQLALAVGGFVLSIAYLVVASQIVRYLGVETASNSVVEIGMENPEVLLYLIPGAYLLIGPGEELLFRGVVQSRIRDAFGPVSGVFIASVVFAAIHITALTSAPITAKLTTLVLLFGVSLILGGVYEYSGNLVVPILIHGSYDALLFIALYVQATTAGSAAVLF